MYFFPSSPIAFRVCDVTFIRFCVSHFTFFRDSQKHRLLHRNVWQELSKLTEPEWSGSNIQNTLVHRGLHWRLGEFDLFCTQSRRTPPTTLFCKLFFATHQPTLRCPRKRSSTAGMIPFHDHEAGGTSRPTTTSGGVLEPSPTGTYVRTRYLKFPLDRALRLRQHAYLLTSGFQMDYFPGCTSLGQ
jgi:hypothetical protein